MRKVDEFALQASCRDVTGSTGQTVDICGDRRLVVSRRI
jgi:hypothetical protein